MHDVRADIDTPALSALRSDGATYTFSLAFTQAPYCSPSRHSFFSGRHPARTRVLTFTNDTIRAPEGYDPLSGAPLEPNGGHFEVLNRAEGDARPRWTGLPRAFVDAGYETWGIGITLADSNAAYTECTECWSAGYVSDAPDTACQLATGGSEYARDIGSRHCRWHHQSRT